ncbi:hypothetical protein TNCV_3219111 [Trichonephila clavipes]|nr:hypothetical protein TNCV_3219111 [Trichonephila clavipes]
MGEVDLTVPCPAEEELLLFSRDLWKFSIFVPDPLAFCWVPVEKSDADDAIFVFALCPVRIREIDNRPRKGKNN